MAWRRLPGIEGRVYVPEVPKGCEHRKHPCAACFCCQWCDEDRCRICRLPGPLPDDGDGPHRGR